MQIGGNGWIVSENYQPSYTGENMEYETEITDLIPTTTPLQSPSIGKLIEALSKAQGTMTGATKDSKNPFFKSNYADLHAVWEAIREPLSKNSLAVVQTTETLPQGLCVVTLLAHSSGEWIRSETPIMSAKQDAQGMGSGITYARRYALAAIAGVAQMDDDGEAAMGRKVKEVKADPEAIKKLEACKSLEELKETWGKLSKDQKHGVGVDNLEKYKKKFDAQPA